MTENDLKKYFSEICFDTQKKKEILLNIMDNNVHKKKKKYVGLRTLAACAAVISVLSIITTAVIANRGVIHELLQQYFGISNEEEMQYIEPDSQQYSCIDKDVRVNILQTLSDNKTVYVLYEIVLPHYETAVDQNDPDAFSFTIDGIANGTYTTKTLSINANTVQKMIIYDTSEKITPQNELRLSINKIFTEQHTIDGNWMINWKSDSESDNMLLNTNINLSRNNSAVIVNQIYLSPLSISLYVQTDKMASLRDYALTIVLHTIQGEVSVNEIIDDKGIYHDKDSGIGEIYYRFNKIQTIGDVTGITIENQYIDLTGMS